jgi:hypothetical protein
MSYENQTRESIIFISPESNFYTALWKNGDRSSFKKLGIFSPPNFRGDIVQDMDVKSISYPITCFFDGLNHIKDAQKFEKSLHTEKGVWDIGHPVYGSLSLQLVDWKQINDPTGDAAVTVFETNWLEPANIERLISADELGFEALLSCLNAIEDGILQLQQLRSDLYAAVQGALNMINTISGLADSLFAELAATENIVNDAFNQAKNTLASASTSFQSDPSNTDLQADVANAMIDVISVPLEANSEYDTRIDYYNSMLTELKAVKPTGNTPEDFNKALFYEIGIIGVLISTSRIIVTSEFKTRVEVLSAIEKVTQIYNDCITELDSIQELFQ